MDDGNFGHGRRRLAAWAPFHLHRLRDLTGSAFRCECVVCLAQNAAASATSNLFADISKAPAVQSLARRVENGGVLTCAGCQPGGAAVFCGLAPENFPAPPDRRRHRQPQNAGKFSAGPGNVACKLKSRVRSPKPKRSILQPSTSDPRRLFYPAWEVLPHEGKLPHADTISDRLQTLVALSLTIRNSQPSIRNWSSPASPPCSKKPFRPVKFKNAPARLQRGDKINPLDLIEWLEEQGYEPEAQVTQKGEIALRGGILDVWPLTSPWPVRLEFFGDELESLRHFDPLTQISREEISSITFPPGRRTGNFEAAESRRSPRQSRELAESHSTGSRHILDYLPRETIFLLCEPEQLAVRADEYAQQIPDRRSIFHFVAGFSGRIEPARFHVG